MTIGQAIKTIRAGLAGAIFIAGFSMLAISIAVGILFDKPIISKLWYLLRGENTNAKNTAMQTDGIRTGNINNGVEFNLGGFGVRGDQN